MTTVHISKKKWSESENALLKDCINKNLSIEEIQEIFPDRTYYSLEYRIRHFKNGVFWDVTWTDEKIKYLKDNCGILPLKSIAKHLNIKYKTVHLKAKSLGLNSAMRRVWSFADDLFLLDNYKYFSIKQCSIILKVCETTIENRLKRLELTKEKSSLLKEDEIISILKYRYRNYHKYNISSIRSKNSLAIKRSEAEIVKISTSIEDIISEILVRNNIDFKKQYRFQQYIADFYIPEANLIIEADGDYWHCNPSIYKDGPINDIQIRNIKRDILKNNAYKKSSLEVVRYWESDINNKGYNIENKILNDIKESKARFIGNYKDESRN